MNPAPTVGRDSAEVLLNWLPLGAGGHVVALNGRVYEAISARRQHRRRAQLFHASLSLRLGEAHEDLWRRLGERRRRGC